MGKLYPLVDINLPAAGPQVLILSIFNSLFDKLDHSDGLFTVLLNLDQFEFSEFLYRPHSRAMSHLSRFC